MTLVRKGLVQAVARRGAGRGRVALPPLADLRRDVRGHPQGGARRAPRAIRALAPVEGPRRTRLRRPRRDRRLPPGAGVSLPHELGLADERTRWRSPPTRGALLARRAGGRSAREDMPAAVGMFERALGAVARGRPQPQRAADGARAARRSGPASGTRAQTLLEEAIDDARRTGDRRSELRATIELQWRRRTSSPASAAEDDRRSRRVASSPQLRARSATTSGSRRPGGS